MREGKFTGFEVSIHPPGIAEIRFNRPERLNGMTHPLKRDLIETLVQAQMDDEHWLRTVPGDAGRHFVLYPRCP